jgi:hypothetical protein
MTRNLFVPLGAFFLAASSLQGGPGSSGGNAHIVNAEKNYGFSFSYPSKVQPSVGKDVYEFGPGGYVISVEEVPYSETTCKSTSTYKTVCPIYYDDRVEAIFIMAREKTVKVIFQSNAASKDSIREDFEVFALSFNSVHSSDL